MGFRDDELATRERLELLEREAKSLREENQALRERQTAQPPKTSKLGGLALLVLLLALVTTGMALLAGWSIPSYGDDLGIALAALASFLFMVAVALGVVSRLLIIVPPGKLVVLSGRTVRRPDGSTRGYRIVFGGRVFRVPILERSDEMDVTPIEIDSWVRGAYTRGDGPADIRFRARVEFSQDAGLVENAIERFLGRDKAETARVARETLEGAVRGVATQVSVDDMRAEALNVAREVTKEADDDFAKLGLVLEAMRLLEVVPS